MSRLDEINEKEESFKRTEKALEDEYRAYRRKLLTCHHEYAKFARAVQEEGYVMWLNGWEKE
jgi:hypothetical protein